MSDKMALIGRDNPILTKRAEPVVEADWPDLRRILPRAYSTFRHNGYALALPQVGISKRAVILRDGTMWLNPSLEFPDNEIHETTESCLSLPGRRFLVPRYARVEVTAQLLGSDQPISWTTQDVLQARVWQHEMDHLNGLLLVGRFPEIRR